MSPVCSAVANAPIPAVSPMALTADHPLMLRLVREVDGLRGRTDQPAATKDGRANVTPRLRSILHIISDIAAQSGSSVEQLLTSTAPTAALSADRTSASARMTAGSPTAQSPRRFFDEHCDSDEQLPRRFTAMLTEKMIGGHPWVATSIGGIILGDRLSDRIHAHPGSRYHDAFHFAHAAFLGWSPVLRNMLGRKRVSQPEILAAEDCQRAQVIEEAIVSHVFAFAQSRDFRLTGRDLEPQVLRHIRELTRGYEVEARGPGDWQDTIIAGCESYRALAAQRGGRISVDMLKRTVTVDAVPAASERHELVAPSSSIHRAPPKASGWHPTRAASPWWWRSLFLSWP